MVGSTTVQGSLVIISLLGIIIAEKEKCAPGVVYSSYKSLSSLSGSGGMSGMLSGIPSRQSELSPSVGFIAAEAKETPDLLMGLDIVLVVFLLLGFGAGFSCLIAL